MYEDDIKMLFVGGLVGVNVNDTDSALTPVFGYGVMEDKKEIDDLDDDEDEDFYE